MTRKIILLWFIFAFSGKLPAQTNYWQGDYSSNWHSAQNWSLNHIPDASENVVIPASGILHYPHIYNNAVCHNFTMNLGSSIEIYNGINVDIYGDANIGGAFDFWDANANVLFHGDVAWWSGSSSHTYYAGTNNCFFKAYKDWSFEDGANVNLTRQVVFFMGSSPQSIFIKSGNSSFGFISIVQNVAVEASSTYDLYCDKMYISATGIFHYYSSHQMFVSQEIDNDGHFYFHNGTLVFTDLSSDLYFQASDFVNNLVISSSNYHQLWHFVDVRGDFTINGFGLTIPEHLELGGNFENNSSFLSIHEISVSGSGNQNIKNLQCQTLILDKPSGEMRFLTGTSQCDNYDWEQGLLRNAGATTTFNDLVDNGIFGTISVTSGVLNFHQDNSQYVDINGTVFISGGTFNIYGGLGDSFWTYSGDVSFTMSGGTLNFIDAGVNIFNSATHSFTADITGGTITTTHDFRINRANFQPSGGTVILTGTSDATLYQVAGSRFHHLHINKNSKNQSTSTYMPGKRYGEVYKSGKSNSVDADSDLEIAGNFILESGSFTAPSQMKVGGNWTNTAGIASFDEGTGSVIFNGSSSQTLSQENFYHLVLNKASGSLIINPNIPVNCQSYEWISGEMSVNNGVFIANDLVNDGIFGQYVLDGANGEITLYQDNSQYLDLNADITIHAGKFTANGGADASYWPYAADASLTMTGGTLDIRNAGGIFIYDSPDHSFSENISGGTIRTTGSFYGNSDHFTPSGGTVELYGNQDVSTGFDGTSFFHNLLINKDISKNTDIKEVLKPIRDKTLLKSTFAQNVTIAFNLNVQAALSIQNGSLNTNQRSLTVKDVDISGGSLVVDKDSYLLMYDNGELFVNAGGTLSVEGIPGSPATITHNSGNYALRVKSGGTISADNGVFEYMNADGVDIENGAIVDTANAFSDCYFANGMTGGTYLTIDNGQNLTMSDVYFAANSWGGTSNVKKNVNSGLVTFTDFGGPFSGEDYDNDPYDRLMWDEGIRFVDLRLMLEGPYEAPYMNTDLNTSGNIPLTQPYNTAPWNYAGTENIPAIPNANVIDWILVEYRDAENASSALASTTIGREAALLLKDGTLTALDGSSPLTFSAIVSHKLFVVIYHRNHLAIMSANPLLNASGTYHYDFTTAISQAYGTDAQKDLGGGVSGMFAGDAGGDGNIENADILLWKTNAGTKGYLSTDFDMNGQVDNKDKNDKFVPNLNRESQIPD